MPRLIDGKAMKGANIPLSPRAELPLPIELLLAPGAKGGLASPPPVASPLTMSWKSSCIALVTEVRTAHGLVALQLGALAFDRDTADLENIGVGGQLERNPRILLDQQDRDLVLAIDRPDDLEDRANDDRRQAEGRFVEEHQARLHEQRAGEI